LALVFREVISALFIGIVSGASIIGFYTNGVMGVIAGPLTTIDTFVVNALNDWSHIAVILFSMLIGAVVSIISKNGGMRGVVHKLEPYAKSPRTGQLVIWVMGVLIFFDDYANTLVVGNTMRPLADKLKISREKLAYLVDSTAAPVSSIAFITTWIGAELGYIESGLAHLPAINETPYAILLTSLQYSFYPIFTLVFMLFLIFKGRDFGPMLTIEEEARQQNPEDLPMDLELAHAPEFEPKANIVPRAINALIPIAVIILGTMWGIWRTGTQATQAGTLDGLGFFQQLAIIIGNSDSFTALLWASTLGVIAAILVSVGQRLLTLEEAVESSMTGFKSMLGAVAILALAWALAGVTEQMHTAHFLQSLWNPAISPYLIPAIVFILSGLVAFSTGSSWGTMAILYPLLLPATYNIAIESGLDHAGAMIIFYNVVSVILAGSVFGDHCSPISDTTILSSLATACNHISHVRTQMPYAVTVATVAILVGSIPAAYGVSSFITIPVGLGVLYGIVQIFGKKVTP
jgi:Na+/H+ antiporter NhaC